MTPQEIEKHNEACELKKGMLAAISIKGAWNQEPNRQNWIHAGLDCMIVRHAKNLHWCGYVGVKPGHPCFGKSYQEIECGTYDDNYEKNKNAIIPDLEVHGGLTYASICKGAICHLTDDPEDKTWWLGFDCAHSGDLSPALGAISKDMGFSRDFETYKTMGYVKAETNRLAKQLSKAKK